MLDNFKLLKTGKLDLVNDNMLYPILRWCSGSKQDLIWCETVNKYFFYLPNNIKKTMLYVGLTDQTPYIKYPKSTKQKDDKSYNLKCDLAKKYFGWSNQELSRNITNLDRIDWLSVLQALGCENKDYKTLGIKEPKVVSEPVKKPSKKPPKTLLDF